MQEVERDARDLMAVHGGWPFALRSMLAVLRRRARNRRWSKAQWADPIKRRKRLQYLRRYKRLSRD